VAPAHRQSSQSAKSRHVAHRSGCASWTRQPKRQVSPCEGTGLAHAQSKGKPALEPRTRRSDLTRHKDKQAKRQVSLCRGSGLANTQGSPTKTWSDHFLHNYSFNDKYITVKRQPHPFFLLHLQLFMQGPDSYYTTSIYSILNLDKQ